ncbi:MAG TPA: FtsX-like permease family protein [Candidatus Bathyarchaeia archaeon]|nr:FtsX-like permease family protein [Candidatus Bathyarchaeia archaeon]
MVRVRVGLTSFGLLRFTAKGLASRRTRTILTIVGLAALILTYVTVQSLVSTLEVNLSGTVSSLGGEIDVWSKGASYPLLSKIPESYAGIVKEIPGISFATPVTLALLTVESAEALAAGVVPAQLHSLLNYSMVDGIMITSNQTGMLAMGKALAATVGKSAGDTTQLNGATYRVSGIYLTNSWMDYSVIIPHRVAQQMIGMVNGTSMIVATARDSRNVNNEIDQIRSLMPTVEAFRSSEAPSKVSPIFASLESIASDITAIVTLGVVLGMMNSNLNNLRERMRAFAIFKATGASYNQIVKLVLYESLLLGALGTTVGLGISYAAIQFISIPIVQNVSVGIILVPSTFLFAVLLAFSVSFVASIYPALRIARVRPQEVFRFG